jgi:hypothetical protein
MRVAGASTLPIKFKNPFFMTTSNAFPKGTRKAMAKNLKALDSWKTWRVEKHQNGEMEPPSRPMKTAVHGIEEDSSAPKNRVIGMKRQMGVDALIDITRDDVVRVLDEAKARFIRADAALKTFRFSCPAKSEEFEEWKHLRDEWDQRDEELQAAREDLRDFDHGKLSVSSE